MSKMVTGANQDINHNGKVFHVQTEDRGEESGIIETLVYTGGEILHSRRSTYGDEMKAGGYDAKRVAELLERQHRRIVLEIRQGRFDPPGTAPQPFAFASSGKTLDQVILDYLSAESQREQVEIEVKSCSDLVAGAPGEMLLLLRTSLSRNPISGAQISGKLISTSHKPKVLFTSQSDPEGRALLQFQLPALSDGTAALIVQVNGDAGSSEMKFLVKRR